MSKKAKKAKKERIAARFDDDSSSALGLAHRRHSAATLEAVAAVRDEPLPPSTQATRALARRIERLVLDGYNAKDATDLALAEAEEVSRHLLAGEPLPIGVPEDRSPAEERRAKERDYLGASVQSLMGQRSSTHHGSRASKGRSRTKNVGTWICKECHLEYCAHRPRSRTCLKCGRERKGCGCAQGRSQMVSARVSGTVRKALQSSSVSAGLIVESVVQAAIESGLGPARVHEILGALIAPQPSEEIA